MFESLLQVEILEKIILNSVLVSIPEEIFLVMFTLILLGEFDYWREPECKKLFYKYDIVRILIPAILTALLFNIFRYIGASSTITTMSILLLFYILIILTNNIFQDASALKWIAKMSVFFILGAILIGTSELLYTPIIQYILDLTLADINNKILLNFLVSIPSRIIQFLIILFLVEKKRTIMRNSIFKYIYSKPIILFSMIILLIFNLFFVWFAIKIVVFNQLLITYPLIIQLVVTIFIISFPILNMALYIFSLYYFKCEEINSKRNIEEELTDLRELINNVTEKNTDTESQWKVNQINTNIQKIIDNFHSKNETIKK